MSKYKFDTTTSHEGKVYHAGSQYELTDEVARNLGFKVVLAPKAESVVENKQVDEYANRQMSSAPKTKKRK